MKNFLLGFFAALLLVLVTGFNGGKADFGFGVPYNGTAIVRDSNGSYLLVNSTTGVATRIKYKYTTAIPANQVK